MNRHERRAAVKKSPVNFRVTAWLNSRSPLQSPLGRPEKPGPVPAELGMTNLQVLARLIAKNGFIANPQRWGQFSGPFGLTFSEYRLLLEYSSYLQGLIDGAGLNSVDALGKYLEPELKLLADEFEAETAIEAKTEAVEANQESAVDSA